MSSGDPVLPVAGLLGGQKSRWRAEAARRSRWHGVRAAALKWWARGEGGREEHASESNVIDRQTLLESNGRKGCGA
jgi:hypothetical protein